MKYCTVVYPVAWVGKDRDTEKQNEKGMEILNKRLEEGFRITCVTSSTVGNCMTVFAYLEKEQPMTFEKIVKFKDKNGKWHAYNAHFVDGFMISEDVQTIQKIINGESVSG